MDKNEAKNQAKSSKAAIGHLIDEIVVIDKHKGTLLNQCGTIVSGRLTLNLLEALFLVERGSLVVHKNDVTVEVHEFYSKAIANQDELNEYLVYSHFRRLGYVLYRFSHDHLVQDSARRGSLWYLYSLQKWLSCTFSSILRHILSTATRFLPTNWPLLPLNKYHMSRDMIQWCIPSLKPTDTRTIDSKMSPHFTVYPPNSTFNRKKRPEPCFFIHYTSGESAFHFDKWIALKTLLKGRLVCCSVEGNNICCYSMDGCPPAC